MTPQRIKDEAEKYTKDEGYQKAYIAGATAEHDRAQEELKVAQDAAKMFCNKHNETATQLAELVDRAQYLVDALEEAITKMKECEEVYNVPCGLVIELCETTLAKWKGEVEGPDDKCRCIQPNWNAFTGKCLTCGKQ